jgi:hypothetical protein
MLIKILYEAIESANIIVANGMETVIRIPVWVWGGSFDGASCSVGFLHGDIVSFGGISPASKEDYMSGVAVHGISGLQLVFGDVMGNCMHGEGGESWLGEFPAHRDKAGAVSSVAIMGSSLIVGDVFVNPVLSASDDGISWETSQFFECLLSLL